MASFARLQTWKDQFWTCTYFNIRFYFLFKITLRQVCENTGRKLRKIRHFWLFHKQHTNEFYPLTKILWRKLSIPLTFLMTLKCEKLAEMLFLRFQYIFDMLLIVAGFLQMSQKSTDKCQAL